MRRTAWSCIVVFGMTLAGCKIENVRPAPESAAVDGAPNEALDELTRRVEALEQANRARDEAIAGLKAALEDVKAEAKRVAASAPEPEMAATAGLPLDAATAAPSRGGSDEGPKTDKPSDRARTPPPPPAP